MIPVFRWESPGPYEVAFSTRIGGVSDGAFESLNLGILTGDEPEHVIENRRLLCEKAGAEPERATMLWQQHGAGVVKATADRGVMTPGFDHPQGDAVWTDEPGLAMMLITANCLPVAVARANGAGSSLAVLHVGWRGLLAGIAEAALYELGEGPFNAVIGPGIGPCCFEVGEEVASQFDARYIDRTHPKAHVDLVAFTTDILRARGFADDRISDSELCTRCDGSVFHSYRREGKGGGRNLQIVTM